MTQAQELTRIPQQQTQQLRAKTELLEKYTYANKNGQDNLVFEVNIDTRNVLNGILCELREIRKELQKLF